MKNFNFGGNIGLATAVYGSALLLGLGAALGQGKVVDHSYGADEAQSYLEQSGYTDVEHTDTDIVFVGVRGCDQNDAVKYEFEATAPNGAEHVGATVCKGLFKGATIRQN